MGGGGPASEAVSREVLIREVGAQGDGVDASGLFVSLTLPGERVRARCVEGRGDLEEVLEASPERVPAPCPHYGVCGGCALQHWAEAPYRLWKVERVRQTLARARLEAPIELASAAQPGSRRRLALHARRRGREVALGFKARRAWTVTPISACLVAEPALVAALPALSALAAPFLVSPKSAPTLHLTLTETGIDCDVTGVERPGPTADARSQIAEIAARADLARVSLAGEILYQARPAVVRFGAARVEMPPGAFLQATAGAEAAMVRLACDWSRGADRVADLYCGLGAFSFGLAAEASVLAAEVSSAAVAALARAQGSSAGLKPISAQARDLDRRPILAEELKGFDAVVFDPPRAGAAAQSAQLAKSHAARLIAVSCNPATFARDARTLVEGGYRLERVAVVDQFLWSPHIELMALFERPFR